MEQDNEFISTDTLVTHANILAATEIVKLWMFAYGCVLLFHFIWGRFPLLLTDQRIQHGISWARKSTELHTDLSQVRDKIERELRRWGNIRDQYRRQYFQHV